ncbi:MAG: tetratricopeptide repeat protein [Bacteroidota bacterium]
MRPAVLALLVLLAGCATAPDPGSHVVAETSVEATSLLGDPLVRTAFSDERQTTLEADLAAAEAAYAAHPDSLEAAVWVGRRLGYLWRYQEAIDAFTEGLATHPDAPELYRHRGHRYLTVRNLDAAVADLERAAQLIDGTPDEIEPDGAPNAAGIPTSTLHTNIWYHLGLGYYLQGRFDDALDAYAQCMAASTNDDMWVATADWMYMTLRRLDRDAEARELLAPVTPEMALLENHAYHRRLLMYKGLLAPDSLLRVEDDADADLTFATQGYGVGNHYLAEGDTARADALFRRVLASDYWPAFGYLAAEAELATR